MSEISPFFSSSLWINWIQFKMLMTPLPPYFCCSILWDSDHCVWSDFVRFKHFSFFLKILFSLCGFYFFFLSYTFAFDYSKILFSMVIKFLLTNFLSTPASCDVNAVVHDFSTPFKFQLSSTTSLNTILSLLHLL